MACLSALPEEIIEQICSYLCPYADYDNLKLVNTTFNRIIKGLVQQRQQILYDSLLTRMLRWNQKVPRSTEVITPRLAHTCIFYNKRLYVFGGATGNFTVFNDLWSFDFALNRWTRVIAEGTCPAPKASASLVEWKGKLIVFGGCSYSNLHPLRHSIRWFDQLNVYDIKRNLWVQIPYEIGPCARSGHGAIVMGDRMIVYGGMKADSTSQDLWILDLNKSMWSSPWVDNDEDHSRPDTRCNCCMVAYDSNSLVVVGGAGAVERQVTMFYSDVWLATFNEDFSVVRWQSITVTNGDQKDDQPENFLCMSNIKIKDKVVFLRERYKPYQLPTIHLPREESAFEAFDEVRPTSYPHQGMPRVRPNAQNDRSRQLEALDRHMQMVAARRRRQSNGSEKVVAGNRFLPANHNVAWLCLLDISRIKDNHTVTWESRSIETAGGGGGLGKLLPKLSMFSLVEGLGELFLFGGIEITSTLNEQDAVSNVLCSLFP